MSAAEVEEDDESQFTLANSDVCTKYREAGRIANLALKGITSQVRHQTHASGLAAARKLD